jgi:hypothetical protein
MDGIRLALARPVQRSKKSLINSALPLSGSDLEVKTQSQRTMVSGKPGRLDVGGTTEFRIRKADENGGGVSLR